jgi:hypothetical protein
MPRSSLFALMGLLATLAAGVAFAQQTKSSYETVSYADLANMVRAERGKGVVVYFWAHY